MNEWKRKKRVFNVILNEGNDSIDRFLFVNMNKIVLYITYKAFSQNKISFHYSLRSERNFILFPFGNFPNCFSHGKEFEFIKDVIRNFLSLLIERYELCSSSLRSFPHSLFLFLLDTYIRLKILFTNISLR